METGYKVSDAMTQEPIAVSPLMKIRAAADLMRKRDVGSLVVKDKNRLRGYVTEQGIVHKVVAKGRDPDAIKVKDMMITKVVTIGPNEDLYEALVLMKDFDVRHLPVVDEGKRVIGLLTIKDILRVQPSLFDLVVEKFNIREEATKPAGKISIDGQCDSCGEYNSRLFEFEGNFICTKCQTKQVRKASFV